MSDGRELERRRATQWTYIVAYCCIQFLLFHWLLDHCTYYFVYFLLYLCPMNNMFHLLIVIQCHSKLSFQCERRIHRNTQNKTKQKNRWAITNKSLKVERSLRHVYDEITYTAMCANNQMIRSSSVAYKYSVCFSGCVCALVHHQLCAHFIR